MKSFRLIDKNGDCFIIKAKIELNNSNKKYFSIVGQSRDFGWQCYNHIIPANKIQKAFIAFWKRWHLNDLQSGCIHQRNKNKRYKISEICTICGYKFGSSWVYEELPPQIEKAVEFFERNINKED